MQDKKDTIIGSAERKTLSGGQRKRVNIALELINDTPVLFLDEPTSGLSSYDAESVIELLKELSSQGKTIITTIHQPSVHIYKQFDDLIMVNRDPGGKTGAMVYFGPAYPDSIQFFNPPAPSDLRSTPQPAPTAELSPEMLLSGVAKRSSAEWQQLYKNSRYSRDFVDGRSGKQPTVPSQGTPGDKPKRHFDFTQWFALVRRNTIVKVRDRVQTAILLIQAPLFAALIVLVYHGLEPNGGEDLTKKLVGIHFLMVIASIWFGCNNAARDIVGEWTVYKRERMVTLKLGSYVFSKLAVLFSLGLFQCLSLLGIVFLVLPLKAKNFPDDLLVLLLSAMVGTGLGLLISAISKTTESAIALLPVVLLPIIALGGGLRPAYLLDSKIRWVTLAVPSQWALEANLVHEAENGNWPILHNPGSGHPPPPPNAYGDAQDACHAQAGQTMAESRDVVDAIFPHDRLDCPDLLGDMHDNFTSEPIAVTFQNKTYQAVSFRHHFSTSLIVLASMLTALVLAVLGVLLKRDSDPQ
jgi:ABC-type multidrug transport system permease subunit